MPVKIFFCYAHEDEVLLNKLKIHLKPLELQNLIGCHLDCCVTTSWEKQTQ